MVKEKEIAFTEITEVTRKRKLSKQTYNTERQTDI